MNKTILEEKNVLGLMKELMAFADQKMGENIVLLDISKVSSVSDYFLIIESDNTRKVKAISDSIEDYLHTNYQLEPVYREGIQESKWILLDYIDFVVHVFYYEEREFYDLERVWKDAGFYTLNDL